MTFNHKEYKKQWTKDNRERHNEQNREWYKSHPNAKREQHLMKRYGMTLEDWNNLFISQNGQCPICEKEFDLDTDIIHVDHNHITGEVRGLLCNKCNQGIGLLKENKHYLFNAIEYLGNN